MVTVCRADQQLLAKDLCGWPLSSCQEVNQNLNKITSSIILSIWYNFCSKVKYFCRCAIRSTIVSPCPLITNQWRLIRVKNNSSAASVTMTFVPRIFNYFKLWSFCSCCSFWCGFTSAHFCSKLSSASGGKLLAHDVVLFWGSLVGRGTI